MSCSALEDISYPQTGVPRVFAPRLLGPLPLEVVGPLRAKGSSSSPPRPESCSRIISAHPRFRQYDPILGQTPHQTPSRLYLCLEAYDNWFTVVTHHLDLDLARFVLEPTLGTGLTLPWNQLPRLKLPRGS